MAVTSPVQSEIDRNFTFAKTELSGNQYFHPSCMAFGEDKSAEEPDPSLTV